MKFTVDTNVLVRIIVEDNQAQAAVAQESLAQASNIVIPLQVFCEFVWVLDRSYRLHSNEISAAIRRLTSISNVVADREAVAAGLVVLDAGGDFADGVIAFDGRRQGSDIFLTFDVAAAAILAAAGDEVRLLKAN